MDCNNCDIKKDLITCYNALKEANAKITSLEHEQWDMKKSLEKRIRQLNSSQGKKVICSNDSFYSELKTVSDQNRKRIYEEKQELIKLEQDKWQGKRVLFVIPLGMTNGGGNVIMTEAAAMRRCGIDVVIMNLESQREKYLANYGDMGIPTIFVDDFERAKSVCGNYDVVCATSWQTVYVADMSAVAETTKTAYYIQDYEPDFYTNTESVEYKYAKGSYMLVPNMVCVTKSKWNADMVESNTGRKCNVLGPSFRSDLFKPSKDSSCGKITIAAMVRPQSRIRSPELTMKVLEEIYNEYRESIEIHIFGNEECVDTDFFIHNSTNFEFVNHELTSPEETAEILGKTDIFVDLSLYQAMGLTAMEAMASGCAVLVPEKGGTSSYACHEHNSLIVDTSNYEACVKALERLIDDCKLRENLSRNAIEDIIGFYPEKCAARFLETVFDA